MATYLVFILLFLLSFIVFPYGSSYFEIPKIFVAQCLIQALLLIEILKKDFRIRSFDMRLLGLTTGLLVISAVNYYMVPSDVAFFGNMFRLQGVYLFWHFLIFCILSSRIFLPVMGKPFFLLILISQLMFAFLLGQTGNERFFGTLGEPHSLAAFALFIFPFALYAPIKLSKHKRTIFSFVAFFISFVLILLSGSRSGMIGLFIECFFLLLTFKTSLKNASIVALALLVLSLSLPFFATQERWENRRDVWVTAAIAGNTHPILGWGVGNVENAFKLTSPNVPNLIRHQYVDSSHNFILDWWIQGGIVGVMLILSLLFLSVRKFIAQKEKKYLMVLFGIMSVMLFNPVSVTILVGFWWIIGQGFAAKKGYF